jgi:hypothetical protein
LQTCNCAGILVLLLPSAGALDQRDWHRQTDNLLANGEVAVAAKRNHAGVDGELHNPARPAFPADGVNSRDGFAERWRLLPGKVFHDWLLAGWVVAAV